ncbi:MAG TPA: hypothetical protein VD997_01785 [Phycisphaerales bacterium]|nr:hypothetical protein [Phycisphaerales bacterium]
MASDTTTSTAPLLIDAKAARVMLCMGERRLWMLTNCGAIPSRKIGKSVRYSPEELAAWVALGCPTDSRAGEQIRHAMREAALAADGPKS